MASATEEYNAQGGTYDLLAGTPLGTAERQLVGSALGVEKKAHVQKQPASQPRKFLIAQSTSPLSV